MHLEDLLIGSSWGQTSARRASALAIGQRKRPRPGQLLLVRDEAFVGMLVLAEAKVLSENGWLQKASDACRQRKKVPEKVSRATKYWKCFQKLTKLTLRKEKKLDGILRCVFFGDNLKVFFYLP